MTEQKALEEFYELGALRLLRVEKIPTGSEEQICRHNIMRLTQHDDPAFFWARRIYNTQGNEQYVQVTFATPIKRGQEPLVWVPPGIYLVLTKR
jgi:hypothetical protein